MAVQSGAADALPTKTAKIITDRLSNRASDDYFTPKQKSLAAFFWSYWSDSERVVAPHVLDLDSLGCVVEDCLCRTYSDGRWCAGIDHRLQQRGGRRGGSLLEPSDGLAECAPASLAVGRLEFGEFHPSEQRPCVNPGCAGRLLHIALGEQSDDGFFLLAAEFSRLARQEMYFGKFFTLDELLESIEIVTADDVRRIAQAFFDPKQIALTILGNLEKFKIGRDDLGC
jgi:hypothetical protein